MEKEKIEYKIDDAMESFRDFAKRHVINQNFLTSLIYTARTYISFGDIGHYAAIVNFVDWCHKTAGVELPGDMTPFRENIKAAWKDGATKAENDAAIVKEIRRGWQTI